MTPVSPDVAERTPSEGEGPGVRAETQEREEPETAPPAPPPRRCYRYAEYPLDAPINVMTDDEYNAYRRWQGFWPGVPPGWPNWPPKPAVVVTDPNPT